MARPVRLRNLIAAFCVLLATGTAAWAYILVATQGPQTIASTSISCAPSCSFMPATDSTVGILFAVMAPSSPGFTGSWSVQTSGTVNGQTCDTSGFFFTRGNNLKVNSSGFAGTYNVCYVATQAGSLASPFANVVTITNPASIFPIKISNGTLQTAAGAPFFIAGDSPQAAITLAPCSATPPTLANCQQSTDTVAVNPTWVAYLKDRQANGINSVWINVICEAYTGCNNNGLTYDNLQPFGSQLPAHAGYVNQTGGTLTCPESSPPADTQCWDLSTAGAGASAAYWTRIDELVALAGQFGIQVLMNIMPNDTGSQCTPSNNVTAWNQTLYNNSIATGDTSKIIAYAQFLATRYRNTSNILWLIGNDYNCWNNATIDALEFALAQTIKNSDSNHLMTLEVVSGISSLQDTTTPGWPNILDLNGVYQSFFPNGIRLPYDTTLAGYAVNTTTKLPIVLESWYQGEGNTGNAADTCTSENGGDPSICAIFFRHSYWWSALSGAVYGWIDGNHYVWPFTARWNTNAGGACTQPPTGVGTSRCLDTIATQGLGYMARFFMRYPTWQKLTPDVAQGGTPIASPFVTANRGLYNVSADWVSNNFVASGAASDNSVGFAYMPGMNASGAVAGSQTVTVNTNLVGGAAATISWYDPTKDPALGTSYTSLCSPSTTPCTAATNVNFTTPATLHTDGYADWVLVAVNNASIAAQHGGTST
jgi:hypothetical protein